MVCRTNQNNAASIKDVSKKQKMVDVNPQQLQPSTQTKKMDSDGDLLQQYFVPDTSDTVKKVKLFDSDRKLDRLHEETKVYEDKLVEYQKKGSSEVLQHCNRMEQVDNHSKLQLWDESISKKSRLDVKNEVTGSVKEMPDRGGRKTGKDTYSSARRKKCSSNYARQHVRRALYRALSSR